MDDELKRLIRLLLNKAATVNGAPTSETFVNTTDSLEAVSDNIGQQDAAATSDDMSDVTTTPLQAKVRLLLNRLSTDAFTATIQGAAQTAVDSMAAAIATYFSTGGAAWSVQVNGGVARANLELVIEDVLAVLGCDGANVFNPSIGGAARTDLDAAFAALGTALGAEFDGSPDVYDVLVTGYNSSGIGNNFDGGILEVVKAGLEQTTGGAYDPDTDSNEAISEEVAKVPKSDAAVTWNATALQSIQDEAEDALEGENLDHIAATAIADTTDPVDMTAEVVDNSIIADILTDDGDTSSYDRRTDSLEALADALSSIASRQTQRRQAYRTTTTTQNSSVTLFALDALGGQKSNVNVRFYLALDAAATFTPAWYITRPGDELTFTVQSIPAIAVIATPAANGVYSYDFPGHLAAGMQLEFRVAQDALGAATVTLDGVLTYQEG